MITRDSNSWYGVVLIAWLGSLWAHPDLVERMMEGDRQSWISAIGQLIAIVAAYLKGSPLGLSDAGRRDYAEKNNEDTVQLPRTGTDGRG